MHVTNNKDAFGGMQVVGASVKSPVIDGNTAYDKEKDVWMYMLDFHPEPGHSGTAMMCFKQNDAPDYVLGRVCDKPRLMGVHTGEQPLTGLRARGGHLPDAQI